MISKLNLIETNVRGNKSNAIKHIGIDTEKSYLDRTSIHMQMTTRLCTTPLYVRESSATRPRGDRKTDSNFRITTQSLNRVNKRNEENTAVCVCVVCIDKTRSRR